MKKLLSLVLAAVLSISAAVLFTSCSDSESSSDLDYVTKNGKLVVGITDYEPMDYKDKDGNWIGFDADFANAFAKELGVKVEFVPIQWDNRFVELKSKSIDCIWNGMTISDSVKTNCDVSKAYATNSQVVVMKKDKLDKYADSDSLKNISIAVEKGSAGEDEAKKLSNNVISLSAQSDALKEVKAGTADACIIDSTMANSMTADGKDFSDLGYKISLTTEEYGIGFRKGSDLVNKVNEFIDKSNSDGSLKALSDKYYVDLAK